MKKKELFLIGGLILFGLIFQYFDSGNISFVNGCSSDTNKLKDKSHPHEFKDSFTFGNSADELIFDNHAGSVEISPSSDGQISVQSVKIVYHKDDSSVQKYRDKVEIRNEMEGTKAIIRTITNGEDFPYTRVRTHFRIFLPENSRLRIKNRFGNIKVENAGREINIDGKFGDLTVSKISSGISIINRFGKTRISDIKGKIELDVKFSDTEVKGASTIDCRIGHSTLYISDIKDSKSINIEGSQTKMEFSEIESDQIKIKNSHNRISMNNISTKEFLLTSRHCNIYADNLNSDSISIKNSHNPIRLKNISGNSLNVLLSNGDLKVSLSSMFESIFVTNSYSDISLTIPAGTDPSISLNTKYGDITNNTGLDLSAIKAKYLTTFSREGNNSQININTSYGDISFSEHSN